MFIKVVVIALTLCIAGCNSAPSKNDTARKDLIQQYDEFYKATIGKIFDVEKVKKWMTFDSNYGKTRVEGVNEFRRYWCSSLDIKEMERRTFNIATDYCHQLNGNMRDRWCRSKEDKPLFLVVTGDKNVIDDIGIYKYCQPSRVFSLLVSTSEGATPEDWNKRALNTYQYTTLSEVQAQEKRAKQYKEKELYAQRYQAEFNAAKIIARGVGRRVCMDVGIWTYSGIVTKIEDDKIHVSVDIKSAGGVRDRNFTSSVAVDAANKWVPCDTADELNLHR